MTSCIYFIKSVKRVYPWLSFKINNCKFQSNSGKKTNAIYYADSMVSWLIMNKVTFNVSSTTALNGKIA